MTKLRHVNMLADASKRDVYEVFQRDYDHNTWRQMCWRYVLIGCAVGAVLISNHLDWLWIFGGIYAAERALATFIDNSNCNWLMHAIDWYESERKSSFDE
jgi:hypothetical protein